MSEISYSVDALNVLDKFNRVELVVHVEGEDDVVFWSTIFEIFSDKKIGFVPAGGSDQLDDRIKLIESGALKALAARDSDYLELMGVSSNNPKVIYTYGYSIENTLHTVQSIKSIVKIACKIATDLSTICSDWVLDFTNSFSALLRLDLANEIAKAGIPVLGDNCSRYMKNESSPAVCIAKIHEKESALLSALPVHAVAEADAILSANGFDSRRWLRGHFYASGVQKLVATTAKGVGRKAGFATDHLFGQAVLCLRDVLLADAVQRTHYEMRVNGALAAS